MLSQTFSARAYVLGLPKGTVTEILREISSWQRNNGTEWTVSRLKKLKISFIRALGGLPPIPDASIAYHSDGSPKGPFRFLFRLIDRDRRMSVKAFNLLMAYTGFTSERLTAKQAQKFLTAVRREPVDPDALHWASRLIRHGVVGIKISQSSIERIRNTTRPYKAEMPRKNKRAPVPIVNNDGDVVGMSSMPEEQAVPAGDLWAYGYQTIVRKYHRWFDPITRGESLEMIRRQHLRYLELQDSPREGQPLLGRIGLIQEPGFKLRAVANPVRIVQAALYPIGVELYGVLRTISQDYCFDQAAGVETVAGSLRKGLVVHSIDLSNATDNFPLELQMRALEWMGLNPETRDFLELMCKGDWAAPDLGYDRLSWAVGQPLGLFPSFAMFSLAHHCVLRGICRTLGRATDVYTILGDDVCIWDTDVAIMYKSVMEALGCPVSPEKTIVSNKVAEFAGVVITDETVYHGPKWRKLTKDNRLSYLQSYADHLHGRLRGLAKKVFEFFAPLLNPIGFESNVGAPLDERVAFTQHALQVQEELRSLDLQAVPLSRKLQRAYYMSKLQIPEQGFDMKYIEYLERRSYQLLLSSVEASGLPTYLIDIVGPGVASHLFLTLGQERASQVLGSWLWDASLSSEKSFDALNRLWEIATAVMGRFGTPSWVTAD